MKRLKDITEMVSTLAVIAAAGVLVWVLLVKQPADAAAASATSGKTASASRTPRW